MPKPRPNELDGVADWRRSSVEFLDCLELEHSIFGSRELSDHVTDLRLAISQAEVAIGNSGGAGTWRRSEVNGHLVRLSMFVGGSS